MDRRSFLIAGLAAPLVWPRMSLAKDRIPIGDMHFHLFFVGPRPARTQPLGRNMASGGATLATWSVVGDMPWLMPARGGFKQKGEPKADEPKTWLAEEVARVTRHIRDEGLAIVRTAADVDAALQGKPHVVLSVEGATFAEGAPEEIDLAHGLAIRSLQLVHYIRNPLGDFQTEKPRHGGLTDAGKQVIRDCQQRGILVDLAHCAPKAVEDALGVSKAPLVWSHGSVTRGTPDWTMATAKARQLRLDLARRIAAGGGVVGLWALGADVGTSVERYTDRLLEMAEWLGEDHVAFGSDMNALSKPALASFADHRRAVDLMLRRNVPEARVRKLAIGNYARVLKAALAGRAA